MRTTSEVCAPKDYPGAPAQLFAIALAGLACTLALVARRFLPDRFLLDDNHILQNITSPLADEEKSQSFRNIATVYRVLNLGYEPAVDALITLAIFTIAVFAAARWSEVARFGIVGLIVLGSCFLCAVVYLAQYTKESIPLLLVPLMMMLPRHIAAEAFFVAAAVFYAVVFRPYWFFVAGLYVVWRVLLPKTRHTGWIAGILVLTYWLMEMFFTNVLGTGLTGFREEVNNSRGGIEVASLITDPLSGAGSWMVLSAVLTLLGLLVPAQLFLSGNPFHVFSGAMIAFLWISAGFGLFRAWKVREAAGPGSTFPRSKTESPRLLRSTRAAALLLAVVSVQAIFEPDFGSYLKHLTPLLPLFLTLVPLRGVEAAS